MKKLVLKPEGERPGEAAWRDLIREVVNTPSVHPQTGAPMGFTPEEMRKRLRVLNVLEGLPAEAEALELEDADFGVVARALDDVRWLRPSQWVMDFHDAVKAVASNGKG